MYVLLPPSETKAVGGSGPALDLGALRFPQLAAPRAEMIARVTELCGDVAAARRALSVGPGKDPEILATAMLHRSATLPALLRYTGVLYDALDVRSLPRAARSRADERLLITSALLGVVGGGDAVPGYRLSAGSAVPGVARPAAYWRPHLAALLGRLDGPVVDLRSAAYAAFAPMPHAISVRVLNEDATGRRSVVSHFNKAVKGLLARALVTSRAEMTGLTSIVRIAVRSGLRVERTGERSMDVINRG
ncbi:YaaA family protein [Nakamurella sp. GG22]